LEAQIKGLSICRIQPYSVNPARIGIFKALNPADK
jgi:hypothetical protein